MVPLVAKTPILFVLVTKLANFMAGSIPIKGMVYLSLRILIALVVAVLHATTIIFAFWFKSISVFFIQYSIILSFEKPKANKRRC